MRVSKRRELNHSMRDESWGINKRTESFSRILQHATQNDKQRKRTPVKKCSVFLRAFLHSLFCGTGQSKQTHKRKRGKNANKKMHFGDFALNGHTGS